MIQSFARQPWRFNRLACLFLLILIASSHGVEIEVANPSFEETSRSLAVGEQTNGVGGTGVFVSTRYPFAGGIPNWDDPVEVPGWRSRLPQNGSPDIVYAGILHPPPIGDNSFITGQDGQNVFAIQVSQAGQALDHRLLPNTQYRLEFLAGIGLTDSDYFLRFP